MPPSPFLMSFLYLGMKMSLRKDSHVDSNGSPPREEGGIFWYAMRPTTSMNSLSISSCEQGESYLGIPKTIEAT